MLQAFCLGNCDHCLACALVEGRAFTRLIQMNSAAVKVLIAVPNTITNAAVNSSVFLSPS